MTSTSKPILAGLLLCLLCVLPRLASALEEGDLGTNSVSRFSISLTIQPAIEIDTVTDILLNITDRSVDSEFSQEFCVKGSTPSKYFIVASGSTEGSDAFVLRNAEGDALPYYVSYRGDPSSTNYDPLTPGVASRDYDVLNRDESCESASAFKITFRSQDLTRAGSGLYSGALTLLVSPV